jgi:hypothetical protein
MNLPPYVKRILMLVALLALVVFNWLFLRKKAGL